MPYNFTTKPTEVGAATFPGESTTGLTDSTNVIVDADRRIRPRYLPKIDQLMLANNARLIPASGGELLTTLPDRSGNNIPLTQESQNNRPTYQENTVARKLPSFRTDGQNSYIGTEFDKIRQPFTIAMLLDIREFPTGTNQHYIFTDPDSNIQFGIANDGTGKVQWRMEAGETLTVGEITQSQFVLNITFNEGSSTLRANGSSATLGSTVGADALRGLQLSESSNGASVDFTELLLYKHDLTGSNSLIESYLDRDTSFVPAP